MVKIKGIKQSNEEIKLIKEILKDKKIITEQDLLNKKQEIKEIKKEK